MVETNLLFMVIAVCILFDLVFGVFFKCYAAKAVMSKRMGLKYSSNRKCFTKCTIISSMAGIGFAAITFIAIIAVNAVNHGMWNERKAKSERRGAIPIAPRLYIILRIKALALFLICTIFLLCFIYFCLFYNTCFIPTFFWH